MVFVINACGVKIMTKFVCMECFKNFDEKYIKWWKDTPESGDKQICVKCYGKHIKLVLLKDIPEEERLELDKELFEKMELLKNGN